MEVKERNDGEGAAGGWSCRTVRAVRLQVNLSNAALLISVASESSRVAIGTDEVMVESQRVQVQVRQISLHLFLLLPHRL